MPNWKKAYHATCWGLLGGDGGGNRDDPGGRLTRGLLLQQSVADNSCLPMIDKKSSFGFVQESKEKTMVEERNHCRCFDDRPH